MLGLPAPFYGVLALGTPHSILLCGDGLPRSDAIYKKDTAPLCHKVGPLKTQEQLGRLKPRPEVEVKGYPAPTAGQGYLAIKANKAKPERELNAVIYPAPARAN